MPNTINQIFQMTRTFGGPVVNMTRNFAANDVSLEFTAVLPPRGRHNPAVGGIADPISILIEVSSLAYLILVREGTSVPVHAFSIFNTSKEAPFSYIRMVNPNSAESLTIHYLIFGGN